MVNIWLIYVNIWLMMVNNLVGAFTPEKYESQIGSSFQLLGEIKNVPNHQPDDHTRPWLGIETYRDLGIPPFLETPILMLLT